MSAESSHTLSAYEAEVQKYLRRNYIVHCLDGGFWFGAMAFLASETVLPIMIERMGGPNWLIALMPQLMMLGFFLPSVLNAHLMERRQTLKGFILKTGVFQRLPYLLAGLFLFFFGEDYPGWALTAAALAPFLSGFFGGLGFGGWIEMTSRLIPARRRSSSTAIRVLIGALIGIVAGEIIKYTLARYPGSRGFAYLHFWTLGFLLISLGFFALFYEPPKPLANIPRQRSLRDNLQEIPFILREDVRFRYFLAVRVFTCGMFFLTPFLALQAVTLSGQGAGFVGLLLQLQTAGSILGNILAGWLGDAKGGRLPMWWSQILYLLICVLAALAWDVVFFHLIFFLLGAANSLQMVGQSTLSVEICPDGRRPTYFAILTLLLFLAMLAVSGLSALVKSQVQTIVLPAALSGLSLLAAQFFLERIREPREEAVTSPRL